MSAITPMSVLSPNNGFDREAVVGAVVDAEMMPWEQRLQRHEQQLSQEQELMVSVYQAVSDLQHSARSLVQEAKVNGNGNGNGHGLGRWIASSSEGDRLGVKVSGRPDPGSYQLTINLKFQP